jgi:glyoxylase-like metal-dependent hydrolase (beta-lactamase superfamily II)
MRAADPAEDPAVCHCLLIETDADGLVLVDTGIGTVNLREPVQSLGEDFLAWAAPVLSAAETAVQQVVRLGFRPEDVRHVVVTHLHRDHCGGLPDFPDAAVHLHEAELRATSALPQVYLPLPWAHGPKWVTYDEGDGESWHGFDGVQQLRGLPADILLVPLTGHSPGHCGVAVRTGGAESEWLLHAGDAYFHRNELRAGQAWPETLDVLRARVETDKEMRLANLDRLRAVVADESYGVRTVSAHDPAELKQYQGKPNGG